MKEIYDWVPWFKELGKRIAEGGEQYVKPPAYVAGLQRELER